MTKTFSLAVCLLLAAGSLAAQQTSPPPAEGAASAAAPAAPPGEPVVKDDIAGGYKKRAELKRTAWMEIENKNLPLVDKLGKAQACANAQPIAKHIEAVRVAANDWISAYREYLQRWSEYTQKDIEENKKFWADMAARQSDIPAAIKAEEAAIQEYKRRQANLTADDEAARTEYDTLIAKANAKLDQLRATEKDVQSIDANIKLSSAYWEAKLESIKKDGELVETRQQAYQKRYDAIIQHWKTVCSGTSTPSTLQDLGIQNNKK